MEEAKIEKTGIKEKEIPMDKSAKIMTVILLLMNAVFSIAFIYWSSLEGKSESFNSRDFGFIIADIYFAISLLRDKPGIRKFIIIRAIIGGAIWIIVSAVKGEYFSVITQVLYFGTIIALMTNKFTQLKAQAIGLIGIGLFVYIGSASYANITEMNQIAENKEKFGVSSFRSETWNYSIKAPGQWKIIENNNFNKIYKEWEETEAEIGLLNHDNTFFCLVIPEDLSILGDELNISAIHDVILDRIEESSDAKIIKDTNIGPQKFEILYTEKMGDTKLIYSVIYNIESKLGLQFLTWTIFEDGYDTEFNTIRNMVDSVKY